MDVNLTYCDDHFTVYTNIESLCCTPETNVSYTSIYFCKKIIKKKKLWYIQVMEYYSALKRNELPSHEKT